MEENETKKRRREWAREAKNESDRMSRKYKKKEASLEVRIIKNYSQASDHSNFV